MLIIKICIFLYIMWFTIKNSRSIINNILFKPLNYFISGPAILDISHKFPDHIQIKKNYQIIRDEVLTNIKNMKIPLFINIDPEQTKINKDGIPWNLICFRLYNINNDKNIKLFPKTWNIVKNIPNLSTISISILDPNKYINPHKGPYKGIMRYFICLDIPEGECYTIIDSKKYYYKNGMDMLWDDTYCHSVFNNTDEKRIVLLCDVYRTDLSPIIQKYNNIIFKIINFILKIKNKNILNLN